MTAFRGVELDEDPEYRRRLAAGEVKPPTTASPDATRGDSRAVVSCVIFLTAIAAVVLIGIFPDVRPVYETVKEGVVDSGQIEMGRAIMVLMLAAAGIMMLVCRVNAEAALGGSVMRGGLAAIINILGLSWMGSSFFESNQAAIVGGISDVIAAHPWIFALGLFALSILLFSQAATIVTLVPVGLALGLSAPLIVGVYAAVNGNFFLPTYGTVLAAVLVRSDGHDPHRQVPPEPQLHVARARHHQRDDRLRTATRAHAPGLKRAAGSRRGGPRGRAEQRGFHGH